MSSRTNSPRTKARQGLRVQQDQGKARRLEFKYQARQEVQASRTKDQSKARTSCTKTKAKTRIVGEMGTRGGMDCMSASLNTNYSGYQSLRVNN